MTHKGAPEEGPGPEWEGRGGGKREVGVPFTQFTKQYEMAQV